MAYDALLIYPEIEGSTDYVADLDATNTVRKRSNISERGRVNEVDFSVGANYNDKLYVGATVGVALLEYSNTRNYREEDELGQDVIFNNLELQEDFITSGSGLNLKLGAIYRIQPWLRLGASINTPTRYSLTDNYYSIMASSLNYPDSTVAVTYPQGIDDTRSVFEYSLRTIWKPMVSAAIFVKKRGFLNVDVEWANYKGMRIDFGDEDPAYQELSDELNATIRSKYRGAINVRVGGEYAKERFRIRGGYAMYSSPFSSSVFTERRPYQTYSGGLGYSAKKFYIDLAYVLGRNGEDYLPYDVTNSPNVQLVTNEQYDHTIALTLGVRFARQ